MLLDFKTLVKKYNLKPTGIAHIGAFHGEEYPLYKNIGLQDSQIHWFEPRLKSFQVLKKRVGTSNCYNVALGESKGESQMFVEENNGGQSSSLLRPKLHLEQYPSIVFNKKETVSVETLDSYDLDINSLNIDVQGFELSVLKGAVETLPKVEFIFIEVNRKELYEGCTQVQELDEFLSRFQFKRVETNWAGDSWGDALYIKTKTNETL